MSKHTPGPWLAAASASSVVGWPVVSPAAQGRLICNVNYVRHSKIDPAVPGDGAFNSESRANAALIAAAPDMYEALKEIETALLDGQAMYVALNRVRAAIAKAEGRS